MTDMSKYYEAKRKLISWYGDASTITREYKRELKAWPVIDMRDFGPKIREFAHFLETSEQICSGSDSSLNFDDEDLNQALVLKLPKSSRDRWASKTLQFQERYHAYPGFSDFVDHVVYDAKLANLPVVGTGVINKLIDESKQKWKESSPSKNKRPYKGRAYAARTSDDQELSCIQCQGNHSLAECDEFARLRYYARLEFIRKKGLCFGCLQHGHLSRNCKNKLTCKKCNKRHPTVIHSDKPVKQEHKNEDSTDHVESSSALVTSVKCASSRTSKLSRVVRMVPVELFHKDNPDRTSLIYAMLDEQSDTTFMLEDVRQDLRIPKNEVTLELSTMTSSELVKCSKLRSLCVKSVATGKVIELPPCYTRTEMPGDRSQILTKEIAMKHDCLKDMIKEIPDYIPEAKIGLLIGTDCGQAFEPYELLKDPKKKCYGIKTPLGWGIVGLKEPKETCMNTSVCNKVVGYVQEDMYPHKFVKLRQTKEVIAPQDILHVLEKDFNEVTPKVLTEYSESYGLLKPLSIEDRRFLDMCKESIHVKDNGHYEMPLPLRHCDMTITNNKTLALSRLQGIRRKFSKNLKFKEMYEDFMNKLFAQGYAEPVKPKDVSEEGRTWYIPHHGVTNVNKPNKIRVVFDCSAVHKNQSLNQELLPGPDLTNNLIGVLMRFRQHEVAFMGDIECMYYQVLVNEEHRDLMRFLWYKDDTDEPQEYRMCVHPFGASSSPGCANFALKTAANEYGKDKPEAMKFIKHNFYVDDGLTSTSDVDSAIQLIKDSKAICKKAGFNLTKFVANSQEVLNAIDPKDRAPDIKKFDFGSDSASVHRALGIQWRIQDDDFSFSIDLKDHPLTRRGILSTVCSIFDPFNFVGPVTLIAKRLLRKICEENKDWDTPVSDEIRSAWERWRLSLPELRKLKIKRSFKPKNKDIKSVELHHFSDAAIDGYGSCSYVRMITNDDEISCSFVMGKSRVAPLSAVTIPRMELTAAVTSARVGTLINSELEYKIDRNFYWCDSKVVLGYISNDVRRFQTFVSNRVQAIRELTDPSQWYHINGLENPADDASRGLTAAVLTSPDHRYIHGPEFLWKPLPDELYEADHFKHDKLPETKKTVVLKTHSQDSTHLYETLSRFSSWYSAKRFVAIMTKFKGYLVLKSQKKLTDFQADITVEDMKKADQVILKLIQERSFEAELQVLERIKEDKSICVKKSSRLYKLSPFLDDEGIIRTGGRLKQTNLPHELTHPVILPDKEHFTDMIVTHFHDKMNHQGRGITLNEVRQQGYWILHGVSVIKRIIHNCVTCRKQRGQRQVQRMSDLPEDRVYQESPFTFSAMDVFGPFTIKNKRSEIKRYSLLFTCMASRAIRLEVLPDMSTDSFMNALRRFVCRNGPVRQIRSDQGTNFIGAANELNKEIKQLNQDKLKEELLKENCDFIKFKFNSPHSSHQGGVFERQIRTARSVLSAILSKNSQQLNDDALCTYMTEVECIVNSRPLTCETLTDSELTPITPQQLLTTKTKIVMAPPGVFDRPDMYSRKYWRRVQHLVNEFWRRWSNEYLNSLHIRQKWNKTYRDMEVGDIVALSEEGIRNKWSIARIIETFPDDDGHIRKVKIQLGNACLNNKGKQVKKPVILDRPIHNLILLVENKDSN